METSEDVAHSIRGVAFATFFDKGSSRGLRIIHSAIHAILQTNILQAVRSWRSGRKKKRKVIHQGRGVVLLRNWHHLLPVLICIGLFIVNFSNIHVETMVVSNASLQVFAAIHDKLLQASTGHIAIMCVQNMLLGSGRVPLGALLTAVQTTQISSLWSYELWSCLFAKSLEGPRRAIFFLFVTCILLAAAVGPSSAILFLPRETQFPVGQASSVFATPYEALFPTQLNESTKPSCQWVKDLTNATSCAMEYWSMLGTYFDHDKPAAFLMTSATITTQLEILTGGTTEQSLQKHNMTTATTQTGFVSRALGSISKNWWHLKKHGSQANPDLYTHDLVSLAANSRQPYVQADCRLMDLDPEGDDEDIIFGHNAQLTISGVNTTYILGINPLSGLISNGLSNITWVEASKSMQDTVSILAVVKTRYLGSACVLKAVWHDAKVSITSKSSTDPYGEADATILKNSELATSVQWMQPVVPISPHWASHLDASDNSSILAGNTHSILMNTYLNRDDIAAWQDVPGCGPNITNRATCRKKYAHQDLPCVSHQTLLAGLIVTGMANSVVDNNDGIPPATHNTNLTSVFGDDIGAANSTVGNGHYVMHSDFSVTGLGYTTNGFAARFSLTILIFYCLVVFIHVGYGLYSGTSSRACNSITDLTTLALHSERLPIMENPSVGIQSWRTFTYPFSIRARSAGGLGIISEVEKGNNFDGWERIVPDQKY